MTKQLLLLGLAGGLALAARPVRAQVVLSGTSYTEDFNALGSGLPAGFGVYTGATAASLGTAAPFAPAPVAWNNTSGAFKNVASATGLPATASAADQAAAPNRALGVRQTGSFGDPGAAFVFQAANTTGKKNLTLNFLLQSLDNTSTRTTTWRVDYAAAAAPTAFTTVGTGTTTGSSTFSSAPVTVSFGAALDEQAGPITIRIVTLTASTGASNRPSSAIDDFRLSWEAPTPTTPALTVAPAALSFGNQNITTTSAAQTYTLSGVNLTADVVLTVTGPFRIAKEGGPYATTLTYTAAELATAQTVAVQFLPPVSGPATGSISHVSAGAVTRTVALSGAGIDPNQTSFSFDNCTSTAALSDGWSQFSVSGAQTWACTTFGHDPANPAATTAAPNAVQINGFVTGTGNVANEDWLISPAFDLSAYNFPLLSFWSRVAFSGPALQLRVSTTYSGSGDPSAATWTTLNVLFPAPGSTAWTPTTNVNLSAYEGTKVYVAFVYTSSATAAARWTIDDVSLTNASSAPAPTVFADASRLAFGFQAVGGSALRPLLVTANDLSSDVLLTSSNPDFTLSKDGTTFTSTLTLTKAEASGAVKAVTVRFLPTVANANASSTLTISTPGATYLSVALSGDTYDVAKTLEVVNWNVEWFGSTGAGLGPTNKDLQQTNVTNVLTTLGADVYALEEVVDVARLKNVVAQLSAATNSTYAYQISDFGSYADNPADPDYAGAQKLAFIYRTSVVSNPTFTGLLRCAEADKCAAFQPWASGRFPYLMSADVTLDGITKRVNFVAIHAKANATSTSANDYARRKAGAEQLKAQLDEDFPGANTLILGDYNDVLEGTIATGVTPAVTSYAAFVQDANYVPLTLDLARAGAQSTASFPTVIDNVIASKPMANYYIAGSAAVRTDVAAQVPSYATTITDHYPVFTRYSFSTTLLGSRARQSLALGLYPNPAGTSVRLEVPETGAGLQLAAYTADGRLVVSGTGTAAQLSQQLSQRLPGLAPGLYLVRVTGAHQTYASRLQKQ